MDVVIIGAGPYGLSIAAHLEQAGISHAIVGPPMDLWCNHMPAGMILKSDGFASNLSDPRSAFTLALYCRERGIPYDDETIAVDLATFAGYGLDFARKAVLNLRPAMVQHLSRRDGIFYIRTDKGEDFAANTVVLAVGVGPFRYIPDILRMLPARILSHSFDHHDLSGFRGKRVAVIGAGASAIDMAALLGESGCRVDLICRAERLRFGSRPSGQRKSLLKRLKSPKSGLGPGWKSRLCTDAPLVFHMLPASLRETIVRRHLGPAANWRMRDPFDKHVTLHSGCNIVSAQAEGGKVRLTLRAATGETTPVPYDHVIAATGYRPDLERLDFIAEPLRARVVREFQTPVLSSSFETSEWGLFVVGPAAALSFGPLMRFVFGAEFAAKRVAGALARRKRGVAAISLRPAAQTR